MSTATLIPAWTLDDRLAKAKKSAHLKPAEMAARMGVHRNTISNWLSGRTKPTRGEVIAWAHITNVDPDWLIGDDFPGEFTDCLGLFRAGHLEWPAGEN